MNTTLDLPHVFLPEIKAPLGRPPLTGNGLDFYMPPALKAGEPPEARGLARDQVRLMVSYLSDNRIIHTRFRQLPDFLEAGDLVVINTSGTLKAAVKARRADGTPLVLHVSTRLPAQRWIIELRRPAQTATRPFFEATSGETLALPDEASVTLLAPYIPAQQAHPDQPVRLWVASLHLPNYHSVQEYLAEFGAPIRYDYVKKEWPIDYYQTVYATESGSAEMPSAGRAFTPEILSRLAARGVQVAPLILHTGVASLEKHEPPYAEFYCVPPVTAQRVNETRAVAKRVVAVGTTVVRALETVTNEAGITHAGEGWTDLVITPARGLRAVNALLTGLHEPEATHLAMLQALAGLEHLQITYAEALQRRYLWHEFGDLHLML